MTITLGAAGIYSDDFDEAGASDGDPPNAVWTAVEPTNTTVNLTNQTAGDESLEFNYTASNNYSAWGSLTCPRAYQTCSNADFEIKIKLGTTVGANAEIGIYASTSDETDFVSCAIWDNAGTLSAFVGNAGDQVDWTDAVTISSWTAPYYLRLTRSGNTWTAAGSNDDSSWTTFNAGGDSFTMTVGRVGIYMTDNFGAQNLGPHDINDFWELNGAQTRRIFVIS